MEIRSDPKISEALKRLARDRQDQDAWSTIFDAFWPFVYATCYRLLYGNPQLSEDASQQVFIRVSRYAPLGDLMRPEAFRSYLWITSRNVSRDILRRLTQSKEKVLTEINPEGLEGGPVTEPMNGLSVEIEEILKNIERSMGREYLRILKLAGEGKSIDQIARVTGRSYGDVGVRLHRIRAFVRKFLKM